MRKFHFLLCVSALSLATTSADAQDPRQVLQGVIQQLQTGQPNPGWYGPQLWQTIAMQTGNTGYYPALAQLGPVGNVSINQQIQMPAGPVYSLTAQHSNGTSTWQLGISTLTNRIEYANFNVGGSQQPLPPQPPATTPSTPGGGDGGGGDASSSEACRKFPNLC